MGKLADKIRNLAKAAKSRREPVVGDIEIDDEPYIGDIEIEDDELDDIIVMSDEDLDNEFSEEAEGSRKYGNRKTDEKKNKEPKRDIESGGTINALFKDSNRDSDSSNYRAKGKMDDDASGNRSSDKLATGTKAGKEEMRGKNNKISDKDEAPYRTASRNQKKLAEMLGKKYARR